MKKIAIDSSVLIEEERKGSEIYQKLLAGAIKGEIQLVLPVVVIMELWAGNSMSQKKVVLAIEARIKPFEILDLNQAVAKRAGEIRRKTKLEGVDAMVAAICLEYDCQLATLNTRHFRLVKGLKLFK